MEVRNEGGRTMLDAISCLVSYQRPPSFLFLHFPSTVFFIFSFLFLMKEKMKTVESPGRTTLDRELISLWTLLTFGHRVMSRSRGPSSARKKEAHDRKELTAASSLFYFLVMLRWFLLSLPSFPSFPFLFLEPGGSWTVFLSSLFSVQLAPGSRRKG